jgi:hypothetical protein
MEQRLVLWRRFRMTFLIAVLLCAAMPASTSLGAEVAGERLPSTLSIAGRELTLAGCAPRQILWKEVYALGLYLPRPDTTIAYIRDPSTSKAVRIKVAYEGDVPDQLPEQWREQLGSVLSQNELQMLQRSYATLQPSDAVTVAYTPGGDTTVLLNGEAFLQKPGHELMNALLEIWLGRDPVAEDMRRSILAGTC